MWTIKLTRLCFQRVVQNSVKRVVICVWWKKIVSHFIALTLRFGTLSSHAFHDYYITGAELCSPRGKFWKLLSHLQSANNLGHGRPNRPYKISQVVELVKKNLVLTDLVKTFAPTDPPCFLEKKWNYKNRFYVRNTSMASLVIFHNMNLV